MTKVKIKWSYEAKCINLIWLVVPYFLLKNGLTMHIISHNFYPQDDIIWLQFELSSFKVIFNKYRD